MNKEYLGDAVYAEYDIRRESIVLTVEDGTPGAQQVIYMEPGVCAALIRYINKTFAPVGGVS